MNEFSIFEEKLTKSLDFGASESIHLEDFFSESNLSDAKFLLRLANLVLYKNKTTNLQTLQCDVLKRLFGIWNVESDYRHYEIWQLGRLIQGLGDLDPKELIKINAAEILITISADDQLDVGLRIPAINELYRFAKISHHQSIQALEDLYAADEDKIQRNVRSILLKLENKDCR